MRFPAIAFALAAGVRAASNVVELLPDTFDDVVLKSGRPALVEFFAPWCGHCKNLAPTWEELANSFAHASSKVVIAKVDADAHRDLGQRFGVQGFPTLKWFDGKSDKPEDYSGGRDIEALTSFVTDKTGVKSKFTAPVSHVTMLNDRTFNQTVGKEKHVLVAFTAPWCGHCKSLAPIYETLASDFINEPSVVIAKVDAEDAGSKRVATEQEIKSYPTIKWFPAGSSAPTAYTAGRTEDAFIEWINEKAGTFRAPGGKLTAAAGTIPELDTLIQTIVDGGDLGKRVDEVSAKAQELKTKYAVYYKKVADKISKNEGYAEKELKRLEKLLAKEGSVAADKIDDVLSRTNILRKFLVKKAEETVGDGKSEL